MSHVFVVLKLHYMAWPCGLVPIKTSGPSAPSHVNRYPGTCSQSSQVPLRRKAPRALSSLPSSRIDPVAPKSPVLSGYDDEQRALLPLSSCYTCV